MACGARQEGDEMACACGLRWPVDEDKPACRPHRHAVPVPPAKRELLTGATREINFAFCTGDKDALRPDVVDRRFAVVDVRLPVEPPRILSLRMAEAYEKARARGENPHEAMARAYRVLLDTAGV